MNFLSDIERLKELWKYAFVFNPDIKVASSVHSGKEGEWCVCCTYTNIVCFACLDEAIIKLIGHAIQHYEEFDWEELDDNDVSKSLDSWLKGYVTINRDENPELCLKAIQLIGQDLKLTSELKIAIYILYQEVCSCNVTLIYEEDRSWFEYVFIAHNSKYVFFYDASLNC